MNDKYKKLEKNILFMKKDDKCIKTSINEKYRYSYFDKKINLYIKNRVSLHNNIFYKTNLYMILKLNYSEMEFIMYGIFKKLNHLNYISDNNRYIEDENTYKKYKFITEIPFYVLRITNEEKCEDIDDNYIEDMLRYYSERTFEKVIIIFFEDNAYLLNKINGKKYISVTIIGNLKKFDNSISEPIVLEDFFLEDIYEFVNNK